MFNKEEYWKNREEGKRGQGDEDISLPTLIKPSGITITFNDVGQMVVQNRKYRRTSISINDKKTIAKRKKNAYNKKKQKLARVAARKEKRS